MQTEGTRAAKAAAGKRTVAVALLVAGMVALALLVYLRGLGSFGLVGPDEPRYAEIGAAMAASHDYLTPRWLGQGWFEKPALYYWMAAASFRAEGTGDGSARLPNALLGLLLALGLALFLARVRGWRAAALGGLLAITAAFLFGFARAASTDLPLAATLAFALMALYLWLRERRQGWLYLCAVCLGLAVLAKGPVAIVLAGGVLVLMAWWQGRGEWIGRTLAPGPIAVFVAVSAPWYVWVSIRNPQFPRVFFLQHNFERFATNRFEHPQPLWFFLPILFLAVFPWSGWSLLPIREAWRQRRVARARSEGPSLTRYLWLWVLVPLVFFSASHSKLPGYILPAVPGLVALTAVTLDEHWGRLPRWPGYVSAALTGLMAAALVALPWFYGPAAPRAAAGKIACDPKVWAAGAGMLVVLALLVTWRRWRWYLAITGALVGLAVWTITGPWSARVDAVASARPLAAAVEDACGVAAFVPLPLANRAAAAAPFALGPCAGGNLYQWHLSRAMAYGLGFYLHRQAVELGGHARLEAGGTAGGTWPEQGLVAVSRQEVAAFVNQAIARGRSVAEVGQPPLGAPWALLRLR